MALVSFEHAPGPAAEMRESRKTCNCVKLRCTIEQSYPQVIHRLIDGKMSTWAIFTLCLLNLLAFCASAYALAVANRCSAMIASALETISAVEKSERLTPSRLAELSEFREAIQRAEELLVKVNRREIARAKPRAEDGTYVNRNATLSKDDLRARAGLIAGRPAPHS